MSWLIKKYFLAPKKAMRCCDICCHFQLIVAFFSCFLDTAGACTLAPSICPAVVAKEVDATNVDHPANVAGALAMEFLLPQRFLVRLDSVAAANGRAWKSNATTTVKTKAQTSVLVRKLICHSGVGRTFWEAFGFNDSQLKKLPSKTDRSKRPSNRHTASALGSGVARAATRVAEILFPGDTSTLLQAVGDRLQGKSDATVEQQFDKLLTAAGKVLAASPKSSVQRRVSRAILQKGLSRKRQLALDAKFGTSLAGSGFVKIRAYTDYRKMADGGAITSRARRISRLPTANVQAAVDFILAPANCGVLSWGSKTVSLGRGDVIELPSLIRRLSCKDMFKKYKVEVDDELQVGRSTFFSLVTTITKSDPKLLKAVDYITGTLVHDANTSGDRGAAMQTPQQDYARSIEEGTMEALIVDPVDNLDDY